MFQFTDEEWLDALKKVIIAYNTARRFFDTEEALYCNEMIPFYQFSNRKPPNL